MTGHSAPRFLYLPSRFLVLCALRTFDICSGFLRAGQMSLCYYAFYAIATCPLHMLVSDNRQHFVQTYLYTLLFLSI
jgi:hypothetical protein